MFTTKTLRVGFLYLCGWLLWSGCAKEPVVDLKTPTQLGIRLGLGADYLPPADGLVFEKGYAVLRRAQLYGVRTEGEPFTFKRDFPEGLTVNFNDPATLEDLWFDVPLGTYKTLEVRLELLEQAQMPSCQIEGTYRWPHTITGVANVYLTWQRRCVFEVDLVADGETRTLDALAVQPRLVLQPYAWFPGTTQKWHRMRYRGSGQQLYVYINKSENANLFSAGDANIGQATTVEW